VQYFAEPFIELKNYDLTCDHETTYVFHGNMIMFFYNIFITIIFLNQVRSHSLIKRHSNDYYFLLDYLVHPVTEKKKKQVKAFSSVWQILSSPKHIQEYKEFSRAMFFYLSKSS